PIGARLANAMVAYLRYAQKLIWPAPLAVLYPLPGAWPSATVIMAALFLLGVSAAALRLALKRPYFAVGWFWFLASLVPVIGLVQVGLQAMADRYTYVPLIGLFVLVAWSAPDWLGRFPHRRIPLWTEGRTALVISRGTSPPHPGSQ